jgi:hypothetical protein
MQPGGSETANFGTAPANRRLNMGSVALLPRKIERENSYLARNRFARIRVMRSRKFPGKSSHLSKATKTALRLAVLRSLGSSGNDNNKFIAAPFSC